MGGFDPVRDSASASPIGPPRFDPVRDSMAPTPRQEARRSSSSFSEHDGHMHGTAGAYPTSSYAGMSMARRPSDTQQYGGYPGGEMMGDSQRWAMERDERSGMAYGRGPALESDFDERRRNPSRSASIADMLNDNDAMRPGSSSESNSYGRQGHDPTSAPPYASATPGASSMRHPSYSHQQQQPYPHHQHHNSMMASPHPSAIAHSPPGMPPHYPPPHHASPYATADDGRHSRASPTMTIMQHPQHQPQQPRLMMASPHAPVSHLPHHHPTGSMMPPSPMQESPRFRGHEQPMYHHEEPQHMMHGQYVASQYPQRSPHAGLTQPLPSSSMKRSSSSASVASSNEVHSVLPSPRAPSAQLERSPSLQNLLNERSEDRRRPPSRSSIDFSRSMGPPVTPGSANTMPFAETPGGMSSPTQGFREPPQRRLSSATSNMDLLSEVADKEKDRTIASAARRASSQAEEPTMVETQMSARAEEQMAIEQQIKEDVPAKKGGRKPRAKKASDLQPSMEAERFPRVLTPPPSAKREDDTQPARPEPKVETEDMKQPSPQRETFIDTRVAYKPKQRVSVPTTVKIPITAAEADRMQQHCRNPLRKAWQQEHAGAMDGWHIVRAELERAEQAMRDVSNGNSAGQSGKKRKMSSTPIKEERDDKRTAITRDANASLVAAHYNARQDAGLGARNMSPILPLRNFNNFVKSTLLNRFVRRGGRALDLGGGKGGDLPKWSKCGVRELVLADIAEMSVAQARDRYNERRCHFTAEFYALDCFGEELAAHIPREVLAPLFDSVSLQFCLHYGWESVSKAQLMLENVSRYLKPGGCFMGTIPDCYHLRHRLLQARQERPPSTSFGNSFYSVVFDDNEANLGGRDPDTPRFPLFGQRYTFSLLDAVDNVAEYVVDWDQLESLAAQNGLQCVYKKPFAEVWDDERFDNRNRDVARRMNLATDREVPMDAELWEACSLYIAFAFEKRG